MNGLRNGPIHDCDTETKGVVVASLVLISVVYFLFANHFFGKLTDLTHPNGIETYDALAESVLKGRLDLDFKQSDPRLGPIVFDLSHYKGKFFLYWGIAPCLLFYIPYRALFNAPLSDHGIALFTMLATYVASLLILLRIRNALFPWARGRLLLPCLLAIGFGNLGIYVIGQARIYEVAATSALSFFMWGLFFLISWLETTVSTGEGCFSKSTSQPTMLLAVSSLLFGLSFLSRVSYVLAIIPLIGLPLLYDWADHGGQKPAVHMSYLIPIGACVVLWAAYNYARFGDPLQVGHIFQQNGVKIQGTLSLRGFPRNIYWQILQPPSYHFSFPFVVPSPKDWISKELSFGIEYYKYRTMGLLYLTPFSVSLVIILGRWADLVQLTLKSLRRQLKVQEIPATQGHRMVMTVAVAFFGTLLVILMYPYDDLRYQLDYSSVGLVLASVAWLSLLSRARRKRSSLFHGLTGLFIFAAVLTAIFNLGTGLMH